MKARTAVIIALLMVHASCKSNLQTGLSGPDKSAKRPADESEGMPGYLTSPEKIQILDNKTAKDNVSVSAPQNTVAGIDAPPDRVLVRVWHVNWADYIKLANETGAQTNIAATYCGSIKPGSDGAISGSVSCVTHDFVILSTDVLPSGGPLTIRSDGTDKVRLAIKDIATSQPTAGLNFERMPWAPDEFNRALADFSSQDQTLGTTASATEKTSFNNCTMGQIARSFTYAAYTADPASCFRKQVEQKRHVPCLVDAFSLGSDQASARKSKGLWTQRQWEWYSEFEAAASVTADATVTMERAREYWRCINNAVSSSWGFAAFIALDDPTSAESAAGANHCAPMK